jgi:hypothetical protein
VKLNVVGLVTNLRSNVAPPRIVSSRRDKHPDLDQGHTYAPCPWPKGIMDGVVFDNPYAKRPQAEGEICCLFSKSPTPTERALLRRQGGSVSVTISN